MKSISTKFDMIKSKTMDVNINNENYDTRTTISFYMEKVRTNKDLKQKF